MNNRRKNYRMQLTGYLAQFTEDQLFYSAMLEDVSFEGLRVQIYRDNTQATQANTSCWFQPTLIRRTAEYDILISDGPSGPDCKDTAYPDQTNRFYQLKVRPRWRRRNEELMTIGFEIVEPPAEWENFIRRMMPKTATLKSGRHDGLTVSEDCTEPDGSIVDLIPPAAVINASIQTYP